MEGAALVAIALSNGQGRPPDWQDFVGIVLLLLINSTIGFVEERNAGNAVKALMDSLAPKARVKRGGAWKEIEVSFSDQVCYHPHRLLTCPALLFFSLPNWSLVIWLPSSTETFVLRIVDWSRPLTFREYTIKPSSDPSHLD